MGHPWARLGVHLWGVSYPRYLGYPMEVEARYDKALDYYKSLPSGMDESKFNRLGIAMMVTGLSGSYQEAPKHAAAIRKEAHRVMPVTAGIADVFSKTFPPKVMTRQESLAFKRLNQG